MCGAGEEGCEDARRLGLLCAICRALDGPRTPPYLTLTNATSGPRATGPRLLRDAKPWTPCKDPRLAKLIVG
jgi:hypothetical protein